MLDDGSTVPATQTATAVSLPEVLATLTTDTRNDLRTLLYEYGTVGLGNGGAEAVNRSIPYFAPAYRRTALTNDALLGVQPNRDLRRLLRGHGADLRGAGQPAGGAQGPGDRPRARWPGRWPARTRRCEASVPALGDTLRAGYPALADLDAALPDAARASPSRRSPGCARPRRRSTWGSRGSRRRAALVQPEELRGLAADLREAVPGLVKLNKRLVPLNAQLRAAVVVHEPSVLVPFAESADPQHRERATPARRCAGRSSAASWAWPARAASRTRTRRSSTSRA